LIKNGTTRTANAVADADATAPSLEGITAAATPALPKLIGENRAPTPKLQSVKVSQGVSQGLLINQVQPVYPPSAVRIKREGAVERRATISTRGDITTVKVVSGDPLLAPAAVEAVKQWKYRPYLLNDTPVEMQTPITVKFSLPR